MADPGETNQTDPASDATNADGPRPPSADAVPPVSEPPDGQRPSAAPNPISGIRAGTTSPGPGPADGPRRTSVVPRIAAVLVMLVVAAAIGYGLAFLSAQVVGQTGSGQPAIGSAATTGASAAPGRTSTGEPTTAPATAAPSASSAAVSPSVTQRPAPAASARFHVVARGETLTSIAARYGVTVSALAQANGITDPNTIYAGQRLVIPGP